MQNALFAGISGAAKESDSDSDRSDESPKKKPQETPVPINAPQPEVTNLLDFDMPSPSTQ
jgi:hypothetical protein